MQAGRWVVIGMVGAAVALAAGAHFLRRSLGPRSIVLVTIDTLRADRLGAYGRNPSITPELDALAARGVVFEKAWTVAPLTVPAHATLLTGLLPPKHGLRLNQSPAPLPALANRRYFTLAEVVKERGYATAAFVSSSVLRGDSTGLAAGFDTYDEVPRAVPGTLHDTERPGRGAEAVEKALAWTRAADGPVFVWVHLFDPHSPYDAPVGWGAGPDHTTDAVGYDAEVAYADHCVGLLVKGLAEAGRGDAVVAVVADHGEGLGEHGEATHGYLLHEATLHVPLVFATPGLAPGRRADAVSTVEVFPTLLALAGVPLPPPLNSRTLFDKSRGAPGAGDLPIYSESLYAWHACRWAQTFALRRGDEKLVVAGARTMTFDLAKDPGEEHPSATGASGAEDAKQLLRVAREAPLGTMTAGSGDAPSGSYWSTGTADAVVLPDEENAKLPSPYDRMDVLRDLDSARAAMAGGDPEETLRAFDRVVAKDPGNIQAEFWRGRCLEKFKRFGDGASAYARAFELGMRSSTCVVSALKSWRKAIEAGDKEAWELSARFLAGARGKGVADDAATLVFEALLFTDPGHEAPDRAEAILRRAETLPMTDLVRVGISQVRERLGEFRK